MINHDEFYPLLKPYIDEVDRLNRLVERRNFEIKRETTVTALTTDNKPMEVGQTVTGKDINRLMIKPKNSFLNQKI